MAWRFPLGFSIAMHCSTKVLKLMCFLTPEGESVKWLPRSLELPVPSLCVEGEAEWGGGDSVSSLACRALSSADGGSGTELHRLAMTESDLA